VDLDQAHGTEIAFDPKKSAARTFGFEVENALRV
jgi:hypothetical protein